MYSTSAVLSSPAVRSASLPIVSTSRSPETLTPIAAKRLYPVTIVQTRYGGIYEGGAWAAFLSHPEEIPPDAFGGDSVCVSWWSDFVYAVGVGATPDTALADLKAKHAAGHRLPAHASD